MQEQKETSDRNSAGTWAGQKRFRSAMPWILSMGKASVENQERIAKEGSAGRMFPVEALKITAFLRATAGDLDNWPVLPGPGESPEEGR